MLLTIIAACTAVDPLPASPPASTSTDAGPTATIPSTPSTTSTPSTPSTTPSTTPPSAGVVVLAGGGAEGDIGDAAAWSARLYAELLVGGDVSGDGRIEVAILATGPQDDWLPTYFEWLGADDAFNVRLDTTAAADAPDLVAELAHVDVFFLKGGDQGLYYDLWNDRRIEDEIRRVVDAGGGVGGTSAGAMSMAGVALAGGADLISSDVLTDACTSYLNDASDGGSGLHDDFLGFVPGAVIDTHFTVRGRLGRMAGALAKAQADGLPADYAIGLDERTGLVVRDGTGTVIGVGAVSVLEPDPASILVRDCRKPLVWTDLHLDQLVDGWSVDLASREVTPAGRAEAVAWDGSAVANDPGDWWVDGDHAPHEERFGWVVERAPSAFATHAGRDTPVQQDTLGMVDANDTDARGPALESVMRALHDHVGATGFLVGYGGGLERDAANPDRVRFVDNPARRAPEEATLVIGTAELTHRDLSPDWSNVDVDRTLQAAGLSGLELQILADTPRLGLQYDTARRELAVP